MSAFYISGGMFAIPAVFTARAEPRETDYEEPAAAAASLWSPARGQVWVPECG